MACWNCEPICPHRGAGPERHYVAGMCGRCHQHWTRRPASRWSVQHCVSKCRCLRCDQNRRLCGEVDASAAERDHSAEGEAALLPPGERGTDAELLRTALVDCAQEPHRSLGRGVGECSRPEAVLAQCMLIGWRLAEAPGFAASGLPPAVESAVRDISPQADHQPDGEWPGVVHVAAHGVGSCAINSCNPRAAELLGAPPMGSPLGAALAAASRTALTTAVLRASLLGRAQCFTAQRRQLQPGRELAGGSIPLKVQIDSTSGDVYVFLAEATDGPGASASAAAAAVVGMTAKASS